jgi:thiol:disulfide interchange protein
MTELPTYLGEAPLAALGAAFGGGLLVSLSPCVYPLVPIISAYVGSRAKGEATRLRAFLLSLGYVVGMATVYALLGLIAALGGGFFGQVSASSWAQVLVAAVLLLLALNLLEVLPFPSWLSSRPLTPKVQGIAGAFLVGAASGLVASPCTSPVLFGLLTYVATTQNALYGALLLFCFAFGMGALLLAVGTFSGLLAALPKPGPWMVGIKRLLGVVLLGVAGYYFFRAGQSWF